MSRRARVLAALVALWLGGAATADVASLRPDDFATGRAIATHGDDPLQTLLLDLLVYRGSVAPALADLRVFNAQGEAVPHAIRTLGQPGETSLEPVSVPVFRLPRPPGGAAAARREGEALSRTHGVLVELGADGAIVRVKPHAAMSSETAAPAAMLFDLTRLPRDAVGLELELGPEPAEFLAPLRVEVSDDLVHFRTLRTRSVLARLDQGGHRIERSDVTFPRVGQRYLLLSSDGSPLPAEVRAARARLAPAASPPPRHEARVAGAPVADEPGAFVFDLGGQVPVDRVQVALPQPNTVVRAELLSRASAAGPWTRHHVGLLYRLDRTPPLRSDALAVPPRRHRWFKLVVSPEGGGLGGGAPTLEASWHPEQLLFVQRGPGPFALAYGRAGAEAVRFTASELLRTAGAPPGDVPRQTASLGDPHPVGDASLLEPRAEPIPPRTYALWAVLILAVAGLLGQSLRLLRQMRAGDDDPPADA